MNPASLRQLILEKIPEGSVIPRHTDTEHLYEVVPAGNKIYKSVTTRLQVLKDEGLMNYKMNRALEYVFANFHKINGDTIMDIIANAKEVPGGILKDAGDIGTRIHKYREDYFNQWIKDGVRPPDSTLFIPASDPDVRAVSGMRALQDFVIKENYIPIICEKLVYDTEYEVAGTLDDIGLIGTVNRSGDQGCEHQMMSPAKDHKHVYIQKCLHCDRKVSYVLALPDLKTSNQFKDHYFFQVAMYYMMFKKLTGLRPKRCFILKVSKEDGTYKIEELFMINRLVAYAKSMLKVNEALDFIRGLRKDNQKVVLSI